MALTKEERDALPAKDFAVPSKRALPIHDKTHVSMAWKMVDRTEGLTPEERQSARRKILKRAEKLGMDTSHWEIHAMRFECIEAMAIQMPHVEDHPNKTPFSGILTRLDKPSDNPLGKGADGKRVILPKVVAEKALPSLLGMAVDFTPSLDGHDAQNKIGVITEANILGDAIHIKGFFYGADFPTEVERIQAEKSRMGFSFEAQAKIKSMDDDPLVIDSCFFTGAAVLYKDKAAYTTTQLSANAETKMEIDKVLLEKFEKLEAQLSELKSKQNEKDEAKLNASNIHSMVKEHAEKLHALACGMEAAGIGGHPTKGHVAVLHHMANHMEAEAMTGKVPHIYHTENFLNASSEKDSSEIKSLKDEIESLKTKVSDSEAKAFQASQAPERKTMPPVFSNILKKVNIQANSDGKYDLDALDKALDVSGISRTQRIALKTNLQTSGLL